MPYALFCDDAKLSKSYPTEADVWKLAADSGLVTDVEAKKSAPTPRRILDNDYEIRPCQAEPGECPEKNEATPGRRRISEYPQGAAVSAPPGVGSILPD